MNDIKTQIERLRRHHTHSINTYDKISLLDLSHSVRLISEDKTRPDLVKLHPGFSLPDAFKTGKPGHKIRNATKSFEYVLSYMPGGVTVRAGIGQLAAIPVKPEHQKKVITSISAKISPFQMDMDQFSVLFRVLDEDTKRVFMDKNRPCIRAVSFSQWLDGDAVRVGFKNSKGEYFDQTISRKVFLKLVANTLGGSHNQQDVSLDAENQFAEAVHYLMKFGWGGLPLPYFIVMKIAQDILSIVDHH